MLLPFVILAGIGWGFYKAWQYWGQQQQKSVSSTQEKQEKLISIFYDLIQQHQGRISIFDFAMNAKVMAPEAKAFLDEKAKEFCAEFEVTDSGKVLYVFDSLKNEPQTEEPHKIKVSEKFKQISSGDTKEIQLDQAISFNQAELARRFNLSSSSVGRKKFSPDFAQWSKERDPQGWNWHYSIEKKRFHPLK